MLFFFILYAILLMRFVLKVVIMSILFPHSRSFTLVLLLCCLGIQASFAEDEQPIGLSDLPRVELWGIVENVIAERHLMSVQGLLVDYRLAEIESWRPLAQGQLVKVSGWLHTRANPIFLSAFEVELKGTGYLLSPPVQQETPTPTTPQQENSHASSASNGNSSPSSSPPSHRDDEGDDDEDEDSEDEDSEDDDEEDSDDDDDHD